MNVKEHKEDLINGLNCGECNSLNQLIALLEFKKYEIVKQLMDDQND